MSSKSRFIRGRRCPPLYGAVCTVARAGMMRLKRNQAAGAAGQDGIVPGATASRNSRWAEYPTRFAMARTFTTVKACLRYCERMTVPGERVMTPSRVR